MLVTCKVKRFGGKRKDNYSIDQLNIPKNPVPPKTTIFLDNPIPVICVVKM